MFADQTFMYKKHSFSILCCFLDIFDSYPAQIFRQFRYLKLTVYNNITHKAKKYILSSSSVVYKNYHEGNSFDTLIFKFSFLAL